MFVFPLGAVEICVLPSACVICAVVRAFGSILPSCRSNFTAVALCVCDTNAYVYFLLLPFLVLWCLLLLLGGRHERSRKQLGLSRIAQTHVQGAITEGFWKG